MEKKDEYTDTISKAATDRTAKVHFKGIRQDYDGYAHRSLADS